MAKIQGKQIDDFTIAQNNLGLVTPNSGDTLSGATVEYVNGYILQLSGATGIIGNAPDGTYTDGLFPNFNSATTIGTAIDDFNQVLLKLAPTQPSDFSTGALTFNDTTYSPRILTSGTVVSPASSVVNTTTPRFNVTIPTQGLSDATDGTLTFDVDGAIHETYTVIGATSKVSGAIRFTAGDPYVGQTGKAGFWSGFTVMYATSTGTTASETQRTTQLIHSTKGTLSKVFYVDSPMTPTIGTITTANPSMTNYISGVPTYIAGETISGIAFDILSGASYFYAATSVWDIPQGLFTAATGDPNNVPTYYGEIMPVTGRTLTFRSGIYSDSSIYFTVRARNSVGTYGSYTTFTRTNRRIDTVSNETLRLESGSGNYPATGYGAAYVSSYELNDTTGDYPEEMQLKNGIYQYPNGDYTSQTGPDYSTDITGTRWATFNLGTLTNNVSFVLTINGASGFTAIGQANINIEIKVDGSLPSKWVDGDAAFSGVGNPGDPAGSDGVAAVDTGASTVTARKITFGSLVKTGTVYVRIGFTGIGTHFTSLSMSNPL